MPAETSTSYMLDIDSKGYQYTADFSRDAGVEVDLGALQTAITMHLDAARRVVTNDTLERIGHVHLAVMINTAARYGLSLGEVMMEAVRQGVQPVSPLCTAVKAAKSGATRKSKKPSLRVVK